MTSANPSEACPKCGAPIVDRFDGAWLLDIQVYTCGTIYGAGYCDGQSPQCFDKAASIVAAVNSHAELVAEVERLRRECNEWRDNVALSDDLRGSWANEATRLRGVIKSALAILKDAPELKTRNFDEDDAFKLNDAVGEAFELMEVALALPAASEKP